MGKEQCDTCYRYVADGNYCRLTGECEPMGCSSYREDIIEKTLNEYNKKLNKNRKQNESTKRKTVKRRKEIPTLCKNCKYFNYEHRTCVSIGRVSLGVCSSFERAEVKDLSGLGNGKRFKESKEGQIHITKQLKLF